MRGNNRNLWLITLPRLVLSFFILLNIIAIIAYPGSTYMDNLITHYSFTRNFLSDLGRTMSFAGEINFFSAQLFNMSLILSGIIFTFFFFHVQKVFTAHNLRWVAIIGSIFGIFGGLFLIGVGMTPADLYLPFHIICATWLFRCLFVASFFYSIAIFRHVEINNKFAAGYVVFAFSILLYIIISELGPSPKTNPFSLTLQVVSQKIILLIFMFSIYIQTSGLKRLLK